MLVIMCPSPLVIFKSQEGIPYHHQTQCCCYFSPSFEALILALSPDRMCFAYRRVELSQVPVQFPVLNFWSEKEFCLIGKASLFSFIVLNLKECHHNNFFCISPPHINLFHQQECMASISNIIKLSQVLPQLIFLGKDFATFSNGYILKTVDLK